MYKINGNFSEYIPTNHSLQRQTGKPANVKVENNGAVVYVGSSLTVHNLLNVLCSQIVTE